MEDSHPEASANIPAMLRIGARIEATCSDSREAILLRVEGDRALGHGGLIHFGLELVVSHK